MFKNRKVDKNVIKNSLKDLKENDEVNSINDDNKSPDRANSRESNSSNTLEYIKELKYIQKNGKRRFLGVDLSNSNREDDVEERADNSDEDSVVDILNKNFERFSEDS